MSGGRDGKGSNICVRCICWCYCLLVLLVGIAACLAYYFYNIEKPKAPTYDVKSFVVKKLDVQSDFNVKTEFMVEVKTKNPNKNIGFIYGADNNVSVLYNDAVISSGKLPYFKQDPANTTVLKITLSGTSPNESGSLQDDAKHMKNDDREIPLIVHVKVPMKVFVGKYVGIKEFMASVSCDLLVDNLEEGKTAKVLQNECQPDVEF